MLIYYLFLVNALAFLLMLSDKHRAKKNRWRISESALIGISAIGGSLGALAGMYLFRHKTRHTKFTVGIPVILVLKIAVTIDHRGLAHTNRLYLRTDKHNTGNVLFEYLVVEGRTLVENIYIFVICHSVNCAPQR